MSTLTAQPSITLARSERVARFAHPATLCVESVTPFDEPVTAFAVRLRLAPALSILSSGDGLQVGRVAATSVLTGWTSKTHPRSFCAVVASVVDLMARRYRSVHQLESEQVRSHGLSMLQGKRSVAGRSNETHPRPASVRARAVVHVQCESFGCGECFQLSRSLPLPSTVVGSAQPTCHWALVAAVVRALRWLTNVSALHDQFAAYQECDKGGEFRLLS